MRTGESGQYEGNLGLVDAHKKSGGQLGDVETTTDPAQTTEHQQQQAARGAQTSENIRYGQTISEGGMSGMTDGSTGTASEEGYGRLKDDGEQGSDGKQERRAEGYGGGKDMDRNIGA